MIRKKEGFTGERILVLPPLVVEAMEADPLTSVLHITDIGYYPRAVNHYRERKEPINQYVLIYCVQGEGWFELGGKRYDVHGNQAFMLPAGAPHAYGASDRKPWTIYWVHFKGTVAGEYASLPPGPTDIMPLRNSRISSRISTFEDIFNTLNSGYSIENLRYASSAFHYFLGTIRYLEQYRSRADGLKFDPNDIVNSSIHYMKENLERDVRLPDIADYLGCSVSRLSAIFRHMVGHPPMTYLNLLRMQLASTLLDTTTMHINQIAFKVGINDPYYFSRLFSKVMGVSPKVYREQHKG